jgi:F-type H+-transporting ATPase subunit a
MQDQALDVGEMVLHHASDAYSVGIEPYLMLQWQRWPDIHLGPLTLNVTPTRHVIFMFIAALLVFLTMRVAGRRLEKHRATENAPKGFGNAIEAMVLFVRNDIAIDNIGENGAKFAPFVMTLFFFILYMNLLGLIPHGATSTGNLGVTAGLAIMSFLVIEISGFIKLGPGGYLRTIFPVIPGLSGVAATAMSVFMAPIEILGKLVKPFALCVRLFGNMTAGHLAILSMMSIIFLFGQLPIFNWGVGIGASVLIVGVMMLEIFVAALQAYVFALLTAVFIGLMQHEH